MIKALEELEFGAQYVEVARAGGWQCCLSTRVSNHHAAVVGMAGVLACMHPLVGLGWAGCIGSRNTLSWASEVQTG